MCCHTTTLPYLNKIPLKVPDLHIVFKSRFKIIIQKPLQFVRFTQDHFLTQVFGPQVLHTAFKVSRAYV